MPNQPVKVYSAEWYEQMRPMGSINSAKKVVDNKLLEAINLQVSIEQECRKKSQ